jgi:hypothetical protein
VRAHSPSSSEPDADSPEPRRGSSLTPEQRSLRARLAAHTLHSKRDRRQTTLKARESFLERFENEVDPDRVLPPAERARRAESAKSAYFMKLAFRSSRARSKNKN